MHRFRECAGVSCDGCERSRMGDAFRPPSPAPFGVVTEPDVNRVRERDLVPAKHRASVGPNQLSQQPQSCSARDFAPPAKPAEKSGFCSTLPGNGTGPRASSR
ncbi:hypothetical protein N657DRAFT_322072 [Parathielavia appendiculata]|uniref:Uncharacterized protein n=1 Tax=Parathielavia appendiculata TaxID=2587402 RepID=A0AAN6TQY3_9PEZI|nr:hypothetical protein N657DRAFT_322072 [Parathielavia appendiculata]